MKKRGQAPTILVITIIALMVGGVLMFLVKEMGEKAEEKFPIEACKNSMIAAQYIKGLTWGIASSTVKCSYTPLEIKKVSKTAAKKKIADELKNCWYKSLGTLGREVWDDLGLDFSFCMVCGKFKLIGDDLAMSTEEMGAYLDNAMPGEEKTYSDYLDTDWALEDYTDKTHPQYFLGIRKKPSGLELLELDKLEPGKDYYVMYTYYPIAALTYLFGAGLPSEAYADIAYLTGPTLTRRGYTMGKDVTHHHTFVMPAEDVGNLPRCELFYNREKIQ